MIEALSIAATGLHAHQTQVDAIANNVANAATPGYKRTRASFAEMVAGPVGFVDSGLASVSSPAWRGGHGVAIAHFVRNFDQGSLQLSGETLDLAIDGTGFIEVTLADGSRAYSRGGRLKVNEDGLLATEAGFAIQPGISIPDEATSIRITRDGVVFTASPGRQDIEAGRIDAARFVNPEGLVVQGGGLYRESDRSGAPIVGRGGENGIGAFIQGAREGSNVKMVDEMVSLMLAQRAYEASLKVVQASDELLGLINGLRK